jgi:exopolysaccharide biosynthesis polyprenyl glycosylphosphotransferase
MVKRDIGWLLVMINVVVDALLTIGGFNLAWWLRYVIGVMEEVGRPEFVPLANYHSMRYGLVLVILLVFATSGIYRMPRGRSFLIEASQLIHAILVALGLLVIALFFVRIPFSSRLLLGLSGIIVTLLLLSARLIERRAKQIFWRRGIGVLRVLVVGDGTAARGIMRTLLQRPNSGYKLWGCLALDIHHSGNALLVNADRPMLVSVHGSVDDLDAVIRAHNIQQVIIAMPSTEVEAIQRAVQICIRRQVDLRLAPELYSIAARQVEVDNTYGRSMLNVCAPSLSGQQQAVKRLLDILLSVIALVPFGLLLMLAIAVMIKLDSPGPIFFRQKRLTRDGRRFCAYKFRSMRVNAEAELAQLKHANEAEGPIFKMRNDPRVTRVGKWLRRTSLDELPQIFNILRGEMSWVGPRPPLPSEVELYEEWQKRRLGTTTGLTGLWQVSGRSLLPFDEMVKLDLYYVENWSVWLDLKILLMTIPAVVKAKGAY